MIIEFVIGLGAVVFGTAVSRHFWKKDETEEELPCSCVSDDEGIMRCMADPRCQGGNCSTHCAKFCNSACMRPRRNNKAGTETCSAAGDVDGRCSAIEDVRCIGGNCTKHCKEHCDGVCLKWPTADVETQQPSR